MCVHSSVAVRVGTHTCLYAPRLVLCVRKGGCLSRRHLVLHAVRKVQVLSHDVFPGDPVPCSGQPGCVSSVSCPPRERSHAHVRAHTHTHTHTHENITFALSAIVLGALFGTVFSHAAVGDSSVWAHVHVTGSPSPALPSASFSEGNVLARAAVRAFEAQWAVRRRASGSEPGASLRPAGRVQRRPPHARTAARAVNPVRPPDQQVAGGRLGPLSFSLLF